MPGSVGGNVASGTELSVESEVSSTVDLFDGTVLSSICEPLLVSVEDDWSMSETVQADRRRLIHKKRMNSVFLCMAMLLPIRYIYSTKDTEEIQIDLLLV
jgi:hypothetical protein